MTLSLASSVTRITFPVAIGIVLARVEYAVTVIPEVENHVAVRVCAGDSVITDVFGKGGQGGAGRVAHAQVPREPVPPEVIDGVPIEIEGARADGRSICGPRESSRIL